ncbi:MAG TPA: DinB family protein [Gemmatimonadales bacterium]|jgi:hypothetical protein
MNPFEPPVPGEAAEYFAGYIAKAPRGDVRRTLHSQRSDVLALVRSVSEERSLFRYASDKWSIREVLSHVNDTERIFTYRMLWFARGIETEVPSFDQDVAIASAGANERAWASHVAEFDAVRGASIALFDSLPDEAWGRRGVAGGNPITVRALAYIVAGHVAHHVDLLRTRYLA